MKFSIKTILRVLFVLSCVNLQTGMIHTAEAAAPNPAAAVAEQQRGDTRQTQCLICFSDYSDATLETRTLSCDHTFHAECINAWTNSDNQNHNRCPFPGCNKVIDQLQAIQNALNDINAELLIQQTEALLAAQVALYNLLKAHQQGANEATLQQLKEAAIQAVEVVQEEREQRWQRNDNIVQEGVKRYWKRVDQIIGASLTVGALSTALIGPRFFLPAVALNGAIIVAGKLGKVGHQIYEPQVVRDDQNPGIIDRIRVGKFFPKNIAALALFNATAGFIAASTARITARILVNTFRG